MYRVTRTLESGEYKQKDLDSITDALQQIQNWAIRAQFSNETITITITQE